MASFPERPARFVPTGDPADPMAKLLTSFLVEAQPTDEQQQLLYGLVWDAKMESDLLLASNVTGADYYAFGEVVVAFHEQTNAEINRQMREALTPAQWEIYKVTIWELPTILFDIVGPDPEEE
jgi:hypothetical protein